MERCTDKTALYRYLSTARDLHLYALSDLDEPFWSRCTYWVRRHKGDISALVLVYQMDDLPVLMALGESGNTELVALIEAVLPTLGTRVYAHVSYGLETPFLQHFECTYHETQLRMIQKSQPAASRIDKSILWLREKDADRLAAFYQQAYPENWFDPTMLSVHPFAAIERDGKLVSVAGIHTLSREFGSAALGSITTAPAAQRRGYAQATTVALCAALSQFAPHIGLNVHAQNLAAQRCYAHAGFQTVAEFSEMMLQARAS